MINVLESSKISAISIKNLSKKEDSNDSEDY